MSNIKSKSGILFLVVILIDQYSKELARQSATIFYNKGFILGLYADLPDSIRIISLGIFAGFIFFFYLFALYVLPKRAVIVSVSLSLLVGGVFGNVTDKVLLGQTIDFIPFKLGGLNFVFNLADIFQWAGGLSLLWVILMRDKLIWFSGSTRKKYLIYPRGQVRMALDFTWVSLACSVIPGLFSAGFLRSLAESQVIDNRAFTTFIITYVILSIMFCLVAFLMGLLMSHRSAGPIYALERYVDELSEGAKTEFKLRDGDHFKNIEKIAEKVRDIVK